MKIEIEDLLFKKYPLLFSPPPVFGIETGEGWLSLIDTLCACIQSYLNTKEDKTAVPAVHVCQVKEKFGTLRFYISGGDSAVNAMIDLAERLSVVTCEKCGSPAVIKHGGWSCVRCPACAGMEPLTSSAQQSLDNAVEQLKICTLNKETGEAIHNGS